jgi:hypothetical protein
LGRLFFGPPKNIRTPPFLPGRYFYDAASAAGVDFARLAAQAFVRLHNPECANLFGGTKEAPKALVSSSYYMYKPGFPKPKEVSSKDWGTQIENLPTYGYGFTFWNSSRPHGGWIFFRPHLKDLGSGSPSNPSEATQITAFFHELEHAANHNNAIDLAIDKDYEADYLLKINTKCKPLQFETANVPITGTLKSQ